VKTEVKYNLIRDRVETYKDFTFNLIFYIYKYYLDRDTLNNDDDIRNHYMFCYNKTCSDFLEEDIDFRKNEELIEYFYEYLYHQFYTSENEIKIKYFHNFWGGVFDIDRQRNKNILKVLVEIYLIFDKSITNEKNILEFV
jgi:hypothetical protein